MTFFSVLPPQRLCASLLAPWSSLDRQRTPKHYDQVQAAVDRVVLCEVLGHVKGNQVEAADLLGISRTTLRSKLRSLGLVVEKQVNEARGVGSRLAVDGRRDARAKRLAIRHRPRRIGTFLPRWGT